MLTVSLVALLIGGLSWLAAIWVERIHRRRQAEDDARRTAAMRPFI